MPTPAFRLIVRPHSKVRARRRAAGEPRPPSCVRPPSAAPCSQCSGSPIPPSSSAVSCRVEPARKTRLTRLTHVTLTTKTRNDFSTPFEPPSRVKKCDHHGQVRQEPLRVRRQRGKVSALRRGRQRQRCPRRGQGRGRRLGLLPRALQLRAVRAQRIRRARRSEQGRQEAKEGRDAGSPDSFEFRRRCDAAPTRQSRRRAAGLLFDALESSSPISRLISKPDSIFFVSVKFHITCFHLK